MNNGLPLVDINGIWHRTYFLGLALALVICLWHWVKTRLPLSAKLLWSYVLIQTLFILEWPSAHFGIYTPYFQSTAGQVLAELIFIPVMAVILTDYLIFGMPLLAFFSSLCVWFNWEGFMHTQSFNSALAIACLPLIRSKVLKGFIILTALFHHGSTALLILGAQTFALVLKGKIRKRYLALTLIVFVISALAFQHQPWFNSGERLGKWVMAFGFWAENWKRIIFGVGPGSYMWYSVMTHPYQTGFYLQMHSDYLQVLWESGVIGFSLEILVAYETVKRAWNNPALLQGVLGCLAFALTYEPLRYFPSALLTAWYFGRVLVIEDVNQL